MERSGASERCVRELAPRRRHVPSRPASRPTAGGGGGPPGAHQSLERRQERGRRGAKRRPVRKTQAAQETLAGGRDAQRGLTTILGGGAPLDQPLLDGALHELDGAVVLD